MFTHEFETYEELRRWAEGRCGMGDKLYYWGWLENMCDWYTAEDLIEDMDPDWFEDSEGNPQPVEIYERDEGDYGFTDDSPDSEEEQQCE